ncbi:MAG: FAD-dependent monooxygenase [Microbacteriaceae bacterium]
MTVRNVLVVGGGFTGLTAAIALAQRGVTATVAERVPQWLPVGHGITVQGNALKVFREIGVLDRMLERGQGFSTLALCHADGHVLELLDTPHTGGEDLPSTMGALRPDLHAALVERAAEVGVRLRMGTELLSFEDHGDSVSTLLSDGSTESWDVVIAADGIKSSTRPKLGIPEDRAPSGMGIWRVVTARAPEMSPSAVYYHGPQYKAGYTVISDTQCYAYVLTDPERPENGLSDAAEMRRLLEGYHGAFDRIRESISEDDYLNFQPIEWLFVEGPWHRGRVIAIGDAVHACPPLIAQGAAQCVEDARLLAEYLTAADTDLESQFRAFEARRKPRVRGVVDASMQLVDWELHPDTPGADPGALMGSSLAALTVAA